VDPIAQTVAEPARLRILLELLGGLPLPAGALAARLGLAPSTVSGHLTRLADTGLINVRPHGRRRLASLDRADAADAVEALSRLAGPDPVTSLSGHHRQAALHQARSCYDHPAGRLGVTVTDLFPARGWVVDHDGTWTLTATGVTHASATLDVPLVPPTGCHRPAVRIHATRPRRPQAAACRHMPTRRGRIGQPSGRGADRMPGPRRRRPRRR
jgi:DNA-binding transcriptional ArsR family regulator